MAGVGPNFLVVGAGRSGTTGLVEGLRTHPAVFITEPKEPHFFALHGSTADFQGPGDDATINRVAVTDRARYLDLYPPDASYTARGDGSVSTLYYHERSAPAVFETNPDMRIVILLREPVDRAYSSYQYMRARGFEPCERFIEAVDKEPARREGNWHHLWHYTAMSHYADAVSTFRTRFGPEQVGVWFFDDLERDYESTVGQILRFIGAPAVEGEASGVPRVNISGTPRWEAAHRLIASATRNERVRTSVKRLTSYRLRERVRRATLRPTGVDPADRAALSPLFDDDLAQLSTLLGDDLPQPPWLARHRRVPEVPVAPAAAEPTGHER